MDLPIFLNKVLDMQGVYTNLLTFAFDSIGFSFLSYKHLPYMYCLKALKQIEAVDLYSFVIISKS